MFALCPRRTQVHVKSTPKYVNQLRNLVSTATTVSHDGADSSAAAYTTAYHPSQASLALRARVAQAIQPTRRITPNVPFWELGAHRLPVLWSLYRGLLHAAPTRDIKWKIGQHFRKNKLLTSPTQTKVQLKKAHRWLDIFRKAQAGDEHWQEVLQRYSRMVVAKREKDHWAKILRNAVAWRKKLQNRTILTGGYMKPTILHGPLPRMKPQPLHVTGMIVYRKKARERRLMRYLAYNEQMRDIKREAQIETMLARSHKQMLPFFFAGAQDEWMKPIREHQALMELSYAREYQRANASFPPKMLKQVKNARRMKVENKTRERQRELAGQVINRTIRRARRGPPAHVLTFMTPRRRYYDRVARSSVTEVGYVGWVKKKLGFKLKNPDPFAVENGKEADQPKLDAEEEEIRKENLRRRVEAWKRRNVVSVPEKGAKEKGEEQNVSKYPNC